MTLNPIAIDPHGAALFAPGAIRKLPHVLTSLSHRRAFLVTDRGVAAAGVSAAAEHALAEAGIDVADFNDILPNPGVEALDAGARAIRDFGECAVVAIGGGAVMDVAKGLALMAVNQGSARDFAYSRVPANPGLPVVAVPTTAGTGSETNGWGVIDDPQAGRKFYVGHQSVSPRFVILDPELTVGLPHGATAAAGMDALCHALESLSSVRSNPYADGLNTQVVRMVARSLPRAVVDGKDLEARAQLLLAAYMAGLAFATTGLGMAHAVGHALSARIGVPHGVALSAMLPHVLIFNLPARQQTYACLASALDGDGAEGDEAARAQTAIEAIRRLSASVGLPRWLGELGCTEAHIPTLVEDALADVVLRNTPRRPSAEELTELLHQAM
jgi:alcohol dehydrogenase class IV